MYKIDITNNKNGKTYSATFASESEAALWKNSCIAKQSWGLNAYTSKLPIEAEPKEGFAASKECILQETIFDEETGEVIEDSVKGIEYSYDIEYTITEEDLSLNAEYVKSQVISKRQQEYSKIDDLLKEALVEKELGSTSKWSQYLMLRAAIKSNNPL